MQILKGDIIIEEANEIDVLELVELQCRMARETEKIELNRNVVELGIAALFQDKSKGKYFKVIDQGKIIGCVLNTYEWSDWRNGYVLWIQSLYLLPTYRHQGLFREIYDYLRESVQKNQQLKGIRLYVDRNNKNAVDVYKAIGMNNQHYEMFEWMKG
jgi:ribosomal protein S18 acetylase RimI-like enzyme